MKNSHLFVFGPMIVLLVLTGAGCFDGDGRQEQNLQELYRDDDQTNGLSASERAQIEASAEARLENMQDQLEEMEERIDETNEEAVSAWEDARADFEEELRQARNELEQWRNAGEGEWLEMRSRFETSLQGLEDEWSSLRQRMSEFIEPETGARGESTRAQVQP